jgi:hypothetical protein
LGRLSTSKKFSNSQNLTVRKVGLAPRLPDPEIIVVSELLARLRAFQIAESKPGFLTLRLRN